MPALNAIEEIPARIRGLQELPPLPQETQRLLRAATDHEIEVRDFAKLIETSPPVTARIVGLAGSAFFASSVPVRSVYEAIVRVLGLKLTQDLVMGVAVSGAFQPERCPRFNAERYWATALYTANLSRLLASRISMSDTCTPDDAYLCGLLHNLGLLALTHVEPQGMEKVFTLAREVPERRLTQIEVEIVGMHHREAGAWLAIRWHLPLEVRVVMEHHHDSDYRDGSWPLCLLVGLCAHYAMQHFAEVEEPCIEAETVTALGIDPEYLDATVQMCNQQVDDIMELANLFTGSV